MPTPHDEAHLPATLGIAVGAWVSDRIGPGQTLGIGWGRTLHWSVRALRRRDLPGLTVVSLLGGIGRGSEINTYETASRVAETLGAQCYYLAAPTFASTEALRDMLLAQDGLKEVLDRARRADVAVVSVGSLGPESTNRQLGLFDGDEADLLMSLGAVGDLLGTFLDAAGQPVDHPLNRRAVGLPVDGPALPADAGAGLGRAGQDGDDPRRAGRRLRERSDHGRAHRRAAGVAPLVEQRPVTVPNEHGQA